MTDAIVPFRSKSDDASGLARIDLFAVELLVGGRSQNLSAARLEAILEELHRNRVQLCALMEDQRALGLTEHTQFAPLAASIKSIAGQVLTQIDHLIGCAEFQLAKK